MNEVHTPEVVEDYRDMPAGPARNAAKAEAFKNQYAIAGERVNTVVQGTSELTPATIGAAMEELRKPRRIPSSAERDAMFGALFGMEAQMRGAHEARCGRLEGVLADVMCRRGHSL